MNVSKSASNASRRTIRRNIQCRAIRTRSAVKSHGRIAMRLACEYQHWYCGYIRRLDPALQAIFGLHPQPLVFAAQYFKSSCEADTLPSDQLMTSSRASRRTIGRNIQCRAILTRSAVKSHGRISMRLACEYDLCSTLCCAGPPLSRRWQAGGPSSFRCRCRRCC